MIKEFKFQVEEIVMNILKNKHNDVTSTYYLLLKKKIRNGELSIADINPKSMFFLDWIQSEESNLNLFKNDINKVIQFYVEKINRSFYDYNKRIDSEASRSRNSEMMLKKSEMSNTTKIQLNLLNQTYSPPKNISNANNNSCTGVVFKSKWANYKEIYFNNKKKPKTPPNLDKYILIAQASKNKLETEINQETTNKDNFNLLTEYNIDQNKESIINSLPKMIIQTTTDCNQLITELTTENIQAVSKKKLPPFERKKVEINMNLNLKSGIVKTFLESNMRNSIKEQYDRYVKKSIRLTNENKSKNNSFSFSRDFENNLKKDKSNLSKDTQEKEIVKENANANQNNIYILENNEYILPNSFTRNKTKKKFLNTSVITAREHKPVSTSDSPSYSRPVSFDGAINRIQLNLITPIIKKSSIINLETYQDTKITESNEKNKSFFVLNSESNIKNTNTNIPNLKIKTEASSKYVEIIKNTFIPLKHHKMGALMENLLNCANHKEEQEIKKNKENFCNSVKNKYRHTFKSPDNNKHLKTDVFNLTSAASSIKRISKFRATSQENIIGNVPKQKELFPVICCKQNLNKIGKNLEGIFGKNSVIIGKNKNYASEIKCLYRLALNSGSNSAETYKEITLIFSVSKLREFKDYHLIKLQSFDCDENIVSKVYKMVKNKLII